MKASSSPRKRNTKKIQQSSEKSNSSQGNKAISKRSSQNENVCAACLFQISINSQDFCTTQCNHFYHEKCLEEWLKQKNTCCLCRQKISKYQTKERGEIIVPERPVRPTLFQLLMSLDISQRNGNLSEIIFFNGDLNQPWIIISSNQNSAPRPRARIARAMVIGHDQPINSSSENIQQNLIQNQHPIIQLANNSLMQQQNQVQQRISSQVAPTILRRNDRIRQLNQVPIRRRLRSQVSGRIINSRKSKRLQQKRKKEVADKKKVKQSKNAYIKTSRKQKIIRKKVQKATRS